MKEKIKNIFQPSESVKPFFLRRSFWKKIFIISIVLTMAMFWYDEYSFYFSGDYDFLKEFQDSNEYSELWDASMYCPEDNNVAVIRIYGDIVSYSGQFAESEESEFIPDTTSSEEVVNYINQANQDNDIKAIIVEIDSPGGYPVASEEIAKALTRTNKPTIAVIREQGLSGAYLAATGADKIFASRISDVGGIGITMSYLDYSQKNKNEGIIYQQLSLGKFKDTGDPNKKLTTEEKRLLMEDLEKTYRILIEMIAENRDLDIEVVEELADGSSMLGEEAKKVGLIDEIGGINEAEEWLKNELGIEPELCFY
jgi:protease-4